MIKKNNYFIKIQDNIIKINKDLQKTIFEQEILNYHFYNNKDDKNDKNDNNNDGKNDNIINKLKIMDKIFNHSFIANTSKCNIKRLYKEWIDLQKSLPDSIYIRWYCDVNRPDLFKILIIPSEDTPYAYGCFIFDLYIPPDYPNIHPQVLFLTTGNGNVRFNPNLYNNGKVCLSLLGEPWNPKISNIYQICLSILGLIFVEEPYFNKPGYNKLKGKCDNSSNLYNKNIKNNTFKYAIFEMFKNPIIEFNNEIKNHFIENKTKIIEKYKDNPLLNEYLNIY